jgi:hypothetical protein
MTLFLSLPRRLLSAFGIALVCAFPATYSLSTYAAELEGTQVPVDAPRSVPVPIDAPNPMPQELAEPPSPDAPPADQPPLPPLPDEHERLMRDNERRMQHNEQEMREHQEWQHGLIKDLNQAFGDDHHDDEHDNGPSAMEALIVLFSVIALIVVLCSPLILIGVYLVLRHKAKARHQQALNNNIDKLLAAGRDIPVELLRGDEPKGPEDTGNQAKGIRNIFLGTGWLIFLTVLIGFNIGAAGFIWIALGASQVLIWYLNRPKVAEQAGQQD